MTPKQVEKELTRLEREYYKGLRALCARVRMENVVPYCIRADARWFCAGMGSWNIDDIGRGKLPKRLHAMLDARDIRGQDIGSQMRDFRRKP